MIFFQFVFWLSRKSVYLRTWLNRILQSCKSQSTTKPSINMVGRRFYFTCKLTDFPSMISQVLRRDTRCSLVREHGHHCCQHERLALFLFLTLQGSGAWHGMTHVDGFLSQTRTHELKKPICINRYKENVSKGVTIFIILQSKQICLLSALGSYTIYVPCKVYHYVNKF